MNKIGFMQIYNEEAWVSCAITQAMQICDKLIIAEGSQFANFPNLPERSNDGTLEAIATKIIEYPGRIELRKTVRKHPNYRVNQCENFNNALDSCQVGDVFIPLDADEFYDDRLLLELPKLMEEVEGHRSDAITVDRLVVPTQLYSFGFAFKLDIGDGKKDVFFRVTKDFHFTPTHNPHGYGPQYMELSRQFLCHHYTWVKNYDRMRTRFQTSGMYPNMEKWLDNVWMKVELGAFQTFKLYKPGNQIAILRADKKTNHPTILNDHPWRYETDVR